jgi:septum formation protein
VQTGITLAEHDTTNKQQTRPADAEALLQEGEIMYCAGGLMVEHALVAPHVTRIDGPGVDAVMGLGKDAVMRVLLDAAGC